MKNLVIVGNIADNPVVDDIAQHLSQTRDYLDLISLKSFTNGEFCPRFILDENDDERIGRKLEGKKVLIVSTSLANFSRDELAMRNCLIARAAKDNGADRVILLEPDLFYSAQDRGPRSDHGSTAFVRNNKDYRKFDGQAFSARLYADMLKLSGVDEVVTVHNHSVSTSALFAERFDGRYYNLQPSDIYAEYLEMGDIVSLPKLVLCAPDKGARPFVKRVHEALNRPDVPIISLSKERRGESDVVSCLAEDSEISYEDIRGKDVVVVDDMVRTGGTIVECCRNLKKAEPRRIIFLVTHFYSSRDGRIKMNDPSIDEIVTTSTIPQILNRDVQGRLRHKMVVLRISRWICSYLLPIINPELEPLAPPLYSEDISSKNPRWKKGIGPLFHEMNE